MDPSAFSHHRAQRGGIMMKQKQFMDQAATAVLLAILIFYGAVAGKSFIQMVIGAKPLGKGAFSESTGRYIIYDVAWPAASYAVDSASGKSGDSDKRAFIIYDEKRREFLKTEVQPWEKSRFNYLEDVMGRPAGKREGKDISPIQVKGSLHLIGDDEAGRIKNFLEENLDNEELASIAVSQEEWYALDMNVIGGLSTTALRLSGLAFFLNFVIALFRFTGRNVGKQGVRYVSSGTCLEQLTEQQLPWVQRWDQAAAAGYSRLCYFFVAGFVTGMTIVGVIVKAPLMYILTVHVPFGLLMGEAFAIFLWLCARKRFDTDETMYAFRETLQAYFPSPAAQEAIAAEMQEASGQWRFDGNGKDREIHGILGKRFWCMFQCCTSVAVPAFVIDSEQIDRIETKSGSDYVKVGMAGSIKIVHAAHIFYKDSKRAEAELYFASKDELGHFVMLARKRKKGCLNIITR